MALFVLIAVVIFAIGFTGFLLHPGLGAFGVICALGLTLLFGWMAFGTEDTLEIKVVGKERIADGDSGKWMVYAAAREFGEGYVDANGKRVGETFENTDAWFHGKTRSTDLYRQIVVGRTYRCKVNGFRSGLLSSYRNILSCDGLVNG